MQALSISRIRNLINKERVYVLMLSFILLVNAWAIFVQKIPEAKVSFAGKIFKSRLIEKPEEENKFVSLMDKQIAWESLLEKEKHIVMFINVLGALAMFVLSLGLFLDIRILLAKVKKEKILKSTRRHLKIKWSVLDIFKLAIIFVFLGYILRIIESQILLFALVKENTQRFIPLLNTGIMDLLILGSIIYFVTIKYNQKLGAIGLKIKGCFRDAFLGILSYIAFLPILIFLLLLVIMLAALFDYSPPQQDLFRVFLQEKSIWFLFYSAMMVVVLGPIVEEVFFRGFAYNAIKRKWGKQRAMALTAVVFAGLHGNLIGFLPIMALGFLLAYVYEETGSLIPSITIHILHNGIMVAILFVTRYFVRSLGSL